MIRKLLAALLVILTMQSVLAVVTYTFEWDSSTMGYAITGYECSEEETLTGAIVLPSTYEGEDVTSIAAEAFWGVDAITTVQFPSALVSIGDDAFRDCTALTEVVIPTTVTSVGSRAFQDCTAVTYASVPAGRDLRSSERMPLLLRARCGALRCRKAFSGSDRRLSTSAELNR